MGVSFSYDGDMVVFKMEGHYTPAELLRTAAEALGSAACPAKPVVLCDMRASLALQGRSATEVQDMARSLAALDCRVRRAAIVVGSDVAFGLMRLGSVFAAQVGLAPGVFRDIEVARTWLLDPNPTTHT